MKTFKPWLLLVLVFLAGAATGVFATRLAVRHFVRAAILQPDRIRVRIERDLVWQLRLDRAQRVQTGRILTDAHQHLRALRQEFGPQYTAIVSNAQREITAILTPEQRKKFERYQEENRPFWQPR